MLLLLNSIASLLECISLLCAVGDVRTGPTPTPVDDREEEEDDETSAKNRKHIAKTAKRIKIIAAGILVTVVMMLVSVVDGQDI
jgi:hypothetical protein